MKPTVRKSKRLTRVMNREVVLFHMGEAAEELGRIIARLAQGGDYDSTALAADMGHLYHHLNTGWNGRYQSSKDFSRCSEKSFEKLRRFPKSSEFPYLASEDEL